MVVIRRSRIRTKRRRKKKSKYRDVLRPVNQCGYIREKKKKSVCVGGGGGAGGGGGGEITIQNTFTDKWSQCNCTRDALQYQVHSPHIHDKCGN